MKFALPKCAMLLADAGGWQAMKEARGIHKAGRVLAASWEPPRLVGEVQGGAGPLKSGLILKSLLNKANQLLRKLIIPRALRGEPAIGRQALQGGNEIFIEFVLRLSLPQLRELRETWEKRRRLRRVRETTTHAGVFVVQPAEREFARGRRLESSG